MRLRFAIPGVCPSVNSMYQRVSRGGKTIHALTADAKAYEYLVQVESYRAGLSQGWDTPPDGIKVAIYLWFWFPDRRRRDSHNCLKLLMDAMEGVLYLDDRFALPRIMDWGVDRDHPRVEIEARIMSEAIRE